MTLPQALATHFGIVYVSAAGPAMQLQVRANISKAGSNQCPGMPQCIANQRA